MKKTIHLFIYIALLVSFASCSMPSESTPGIILERTFANDFFSMDYPDGFSPIKIGDVNPGVIISSKDSKMLIETYANWNDNCRNGDTYRLWHNGEDFWDELTEVQLGEENALFCYTKDEYEWPFMSVTIPKNGWELIGTASGFDESDYDLAKTVLFSLRLTDPDFEIPFEGAVYEAYDLSQKPEFSDEIHKIGAITLRSDCEEKSSNDSITKLKCDEYQINVVHIDDWKSHFGELQYVSKMQDWEGFDLGSQVVMEIEVDGMAAFWSETLKEKKKSISLTIPFEGGYVLVSVTGMIDADSIKRAADDILSIELLDSLHFGAK